MVFYCFDSSGLTKRYTPEQGTRWVRTIANAPSNIVVVSDFTSVEVFSAVWRKQREGRIAQANAQRIGYAIRQHFAQDYLVIEMDEPIIRRAEDLLTQYPIRGADAVQLATALESQQLLGVSVIFVCADLRLIPIAVSEGLAVEDPNAHP